MEKQNYNKIITKLLSQQNCNFFEENVSMYYTNVKLKEKFEKVKKSKTKRK